MRLMIALTAGLILGSVATTKAHADPAFLDWRDARRAYCHVFAEAYRPQGSEIVVEALDYCRNLSNVQFAAYTGVAMPLSRAEEEQASELIDACYTESVDGGYVRVVKDCETNMSTEPLPIEEAVKQASRTDACGIRISREGWSVIYNCQ